MLCYLKKLSIKQRLKTDILYISVNCTYLLILLTGFVHDCKLDKKYYKYGQLQISPDFTAA